MDLKDATPDWPHAPVHRLRDAGIYIVTAGTYNRAHHFHDAERLTYLTKTLLALASKYGWEVQAWAVFSNHYHFVAESEQPDTLRRLMRHLHSVVRKRNQLEGWDSWQGGLVSILGDTTDLPEVLFGAAELRAHERGSAWTGPRTEFIPVVFCGLVSANFFAGISCDCYGISFGSGERS